MQNNGINRQNCYIVLNCVCVAEGHGMHVYVCLRGHHKANIDTVRRNEMYFPIYKNLKFLLFVKEPNSVGFFSV